MSRVIVLGTANVGLMAAVFLFAKQQFGRTPDWLGAESSLWLGASLGMVAVVLYFLANRMKRTGTDL